MTVPCVCERAQFAVGAVLLGTLYLQRRRTLLAQQAAAELSATSMHAHIMQYICHELRQARARVFFAGGRVLAYKRMA